jgi:hypothetical protein
MAFMELEWREREEETVAAVQSRALLLAGWCPGVVLGSALSVGASVGCSAARGCVLRGVGLLARGQGSREAGRERNGKERDGRVGLLARERKAGKEKEVAAVASRGGSRVGRALMGLMGR